MDYLPRAPDNRQVELAAPASGLGEVLEQLRHGLIGGVGGASIRIDGAEAFRVDFQAQRVWPVLPGDESASDSAPAWLLPAATDRALTLAPVATPPAPSGGAGYPLNRMIWDSALELDVETLPTPVSEHAVVRLKCWPGFHLLAHHHDHFRLSSLLLRRPGSMRECAGLLQIGIREAMAFARAAYFIGCAELEAGPAPSTRRVAEAPSRWAGSRLVGWWREVRQEQRKRHAS